ncbi:MAG: hypothetical protein ACR2OB_03370 [Solirubrobacteraceae bacterium]
MAILLQAAQQSHLPLFTGLLVLGLVVGVAGHMCRSRMLVVAGILVIGGVSAYFSFVLQPSGG